MSEENPGLIYKKMSLIMSEVKAIEKKTHPGGGIRYAYRGIEDIYNELSGLMALHKVFTIPTVLDIKREERKSSGGGLLIYTILTIKYTFYTEDGSFVESITVGEAFDTSDKSCNKAMSAAHKYTLVQSFLIRTGEPNDSEEDDLEPEAGTSGKQTANKQSQASSTSNSSAKKCPKCNSPLKKRTSSTGGFWGCTGYPNCKHTESIANTATTSNQEPPENESTLTPEQQLLSEQMNQYFGNKEKSKTDWITNYGAPCVADLVGDELGLALSAIAAMLDKQPKQEEIPF